MNGNFEAQFSTQGDASPADVALSSLNDAMRMLHLQVEAVGKRFSPALRPDSPSACPSEKSEIKPAASALVHAIEDLTQQAERAREHLANILSRSDI